VNPVTSGGFAAKDEYLSGAADKIVPQILLFQEAYRSDVYQAVLCVSYIKEECARDRWHIDDAAVIPSSVNSFF